MEVWSCFLSWIKFGRNSSFGSLSRILWWYNCNHKFHTFWSFRNWRFSIWEIMNQLWQLTNSLRAVMGCSMLFLTCKPANFQIMVFCVELNDGIIRIHLFRTTFLRFSYNPLWDVVPRDNGNKAYLFWWL